MSKRVKIFFILLFLIVSIIFIQSGGFSNLIPIDTNNFNNKYSNGWYDFSFRYPDSAEIQEPLGHKYQDKGDIIVSYEVDVREILSGIPGSKPCTIKVYPVGNQFAPNIDNDVIVNLGKYQWKKKKYVSDPWDVLFRYEGVIWVIEKNGYIYVGRSQHDNEKWCEAILSTVDFRADDAVETARQASNAKGVAMLYINQNYPGMKFKTGYFIVTSNFSSTSILNSTDSAIVEFAESPNTKRLETKALQLGYDSGKWIVLGETDSF